MTCTYTTPTIDMERYSWLRQHEPTFHAWVQENMPELEHAFCIRALNEALTRWSADIYVTPRQIIDGSPLVATTTITTTPARLDWTRP